MTKMIMRLELLTKHVMANYLGGSQSAYQMKGRNQGSMDHHRDHDWYEKH